MVERRSVEEALVWSAIAVAVAAAVAACVLTGFELRIEASIGAELEQRVFRYTTEPSLADLRPIGPLALGAALALVAAAALALARGARPWLVVASFVLAWSLGLLVYDVDDRRLEGWSNVGVTGYEEPNGGPLLQPELDDLKARARRSPEAQRPGWQLLAEHGYAARGRTGWRLFEWSVLALAWLTAYRVARLRLNAPTAAFVVAVASLALLVVYVFSDLSGLE